MGFLTVAVCFRRVLLSRGVIRFAVVLSGHPMRLRCSFVMLGSLIVRGLRHVHFQFCHCTTDVQCRANMGRCKLVPIRLNKGFQQGSMQPLGLMKPLSSCCYTTGRLYARSRHAFTPRGWEAGVYGRELKSACRSCAWSVK